MVKGNLKTTSLSSREKRVLDAFRESSSKSLNMTVLKELTGLDRSRLKKTIDKLQDKGFLRKTTERRLSFWKVSKTTGLESAVEEMTEQGIISEKSEVVTT